MIEVKAIEREIARRRRRAKQLGVDRLIARIYFEHGFRNYGFISPERMAGVFPSVTEVRERERDHFYFKIEDRPYMIAAHERSYEGREGVELEIYRRDQLVFGEILDRSYTGGYRARRVTGFVEGPWIEDFERLDQEAQDFKLNRREVHRAGNIEERAQRFGIDATRQPEPTGFWARVRRSLFFRSANSPD